MSDKPYNQLNELDKLIRQAEDPDMGSGVQVTIEYVTGFELFNTRPYHNYETWSGGYRVYGLGIDVSSEDLDDAVKLWAKSVKQKKESHEKEHDETNSR